jgi:AraC-like DNA-binding protein
MNELERANNGADLSSVVKNNQLTSLEVYDKFGAMAYGIILQIIPQPHLAQEILVNVFSSPQLQSCNSYPFTFAVCIIKLARAHAVEAKRKLMSVAPDNTGITYNREDGSPQLIFDLAFRQGNTPEEVAQKLNISKSEVLKAFHDFFKTHRNS